MFHAFLNVKSLAGVAAASDRGADDFVRRRRRRAGSGKNDLVAVTQPRDLALEKDGALDDERTGAARLEGDAHVLADGADDVDGRIVVDLNSAAAGNVAIDDEKAVLRLQESALGDRHVKIVAALDETMAAEHAAGIDLQRVGGEAALAAADLERTAAEIDAAGEGLVEIRVRGSKIV